LQEIILQLLEERERPIRALELREMVERRGKAIPPSLVFRAIARLIERGRIRKVLLARGYVAGSGDGVIMLICRGCGTVRAIANAEIVGALDRLAANEGLSAARRHIECAGLCPDCISRAHDGG
jgi:Fe2+ or Zn2+ uptake regulation protein